LIKNARVELIYEKYDRDVKFSNAQFTAAGPGGVFPFTHPGHSASQKEDRLMARFGFPVGNTVILQLDAGVTDSEESEDLVGILGGGIRVHAYESDTVDASIFALAHYVPEIEYKWSTTDSTLGRAFSTQEESYWEASGGFLLSRAFALEKESTLTPYGGIMISVFQGDEDWTALYPDTGLIEKGSGDLEGDGVFSVLGGLAFMFNPALSVRVEGRFVNRTSISAALAMSF